MAIYFVLQQWSFVIALTMTSNDLATTAKFGQRIWNSFSNIRMNRKLYLSQISSGCATKKLQVQYVPSILNCSQPEIIARVNWPHGGPLKAPLETPQTLWNYGVEVFGGPDYANILDKR